MIVFLHGWGADMNSFLWLKDVFLEEWSMLFVDFAGFGKTKEPDRPFFVRDYVLEVKELVDKFEVSEIVLIGHSFGGRVAIKYSFLFESFYEKLSLVLVDSAGILPRRSLFYYLKVKKYKWLKAKAAQNENYIIRLKKYGSSDYKQLSPLMKQTFVNVVNEDLSCDAKFIKAKAIIVWGENDKETKPYMARRLNRLIKNSKLYFLKDAGHFSFLENKEEFVIILDTFLKNI